MRNFKNKLNMGKLFLFKEIFYFIIGYGKKIMSFGVK